nr:hypothetical protein [Corynebacterium amycolatum]
MPGILGGVFRIIACPVGLVPELAERIIVGLELLFQLVELGTGVVELDLPVLRSRIVLPERRGRVLQRGLECFDLGLLGLDLFGQHLVAGGQRLGGLVVLVELGGHQFHLRAQHPHLTVDVGDGPLELAFTFQTDLETKR